MAKIFVSHSRHDRDLVDFLSRVAAGTQVQLVFEELEGMINGRVTAAKIQADIEASNAVFVLVTPKLGEISHSRDWVAWETGVAAKRDVWVLERRADFGLIEMVTPALSHLVRYDPTDEWFPYFRAIIESYDDSHIFPAVAAGSGIGHVLGKGDGALLGAGLALLLAHLAGQRPPGVPARCGNCASTYSVHVAANEATFRCPVCNLRVTLGLLALQPLPFLNAPKLASPPLVQQDQSKSRG